MLHCGRDLPLPKQLHGLPEGKSETMVSGDPKLVLFN